MLTELTIHDVNIILVLILFMSISHAIFTPIFPSLSRSSLQSHFSKFVILECMYVLT